jgi:sigma-54 specific flagellar transcriptional regulator A|tara:strand:+ start:165 stop:1328 length:1164 start_codon:yes stop_codon:yes gene_type:complete
MMRSKDISSERILGKSIAIERLRAIVTQCANSNAPVLLRGESGTGKELVSRALHDSSERASHPFVAINCGAIPDQLLESELFGHRKGSFTGATCDRKGRFELAHMGTLFLDEIGDMPSQLQVKFLRVLEEKIVEPVGGGAEIRIDVRIIAATHRNLEEMVSEGKFREDLLYRLNVLPISIPALDQRSEDIPGLLAHFSNVFGADGEKITFSKRSLLLLQAYSWPGNVRELANFVQRFSVLYPGKIIEISRVPDDFLTKELIELVQLYEAPAYDEDHRESAGLNDEIVAAGVPQHSQLSQEYEIGNDSMQGSNLYENDFEQIIELSNSMSELPAEGVSTKDLLNNLEANLIRTALTQTDGNVSKASELLQLGRTSLIQKITKYQLVKV